MNAIALLFPLLVLSPAGDEPSRNDLQGDPLPAGVIARMGSGRMRQPWGFGCLVLSRDAKIVVTATSFSDVILCAWDASSAKPLWRVDFPTKPPTWPSLDMITTRTGRLVVLIGGTATSRAVARTFDLATGKELSNTELRLAADDDLSNPVLSPDGTTLAIRTNNGTLRLYDLDQGRETLQIAVTQPQESIQCTWSPDSKKLAVRFVGGTTIRIHDAKSGKRIAEVRQEGFYVPWVEFSADGRLLACSTSAEMGKDSPLTVWDLATGKEVYRETHDSWVMARFSPDGKHLAVGRRVHLALVEATSGKLVRTFPVTGASLMAFSPDGRTLVVGHGNSVSQWDVASGRVLDSSANPRRNVNALRFDAAGKRLLGQADNFIAWDATTGKELHQFSNGHDHLPGQLDLSQDESVLVGPEHTRKKALLWKAASGKTLAKPLGSIEPEGGVVITMLTPDGRRLVTGGKEIQLWDVETRRVLHKLSGNWQGGWPRAMSRDGRWLISEKIDPRGGPSVVRLWDLTTGREVRQFTTRGGYACVAGLSPDGRWLATYGSADRLGEAGSFTLWDATTGRELRSWPAAVGYLRSLVFSPDGRMLASAGCYLTKNKGTLSLWETATGKRRRDFEGHEDLVESVAFSPDGHRLAAASGDAPVYVWDIWPGVPAGRKLSADELERCYTDLAGEDAAMAFRAIRLLSTAPEQATPFLRERLKRVPMPDAERVRRLIADLDSKKFNERQKAAVELERLGDAAAHLLEQAVSKASSVETRQRLEKLLARFETATTQGIRIVRAVEALEWTRTPEARELIDDLAQGAPGALLTREAIKARDRLRQAGKSTS